MDGDKITLDRETFKALAVDTRVKILKILDERQHTLSDLAEELSMAPSTIKEHLDTLVSAGLIKQEDKGMKWKYYKLTFKGRELINPYEKKVWVILATSLVALGVTAYTLLSKIQGLGSFIGMEENSKSSLIAPTIQSYSSDLASPPAPVPGSVCEAFSSAAGTVTTTLNGVVTTLSDASSPLLGGAGPPDAFDRATSLSENTSMNYDGTMLKTAGEKAGEIVSATATTVTSTVNTVTTTILDASRHVANGLNDNGAMAQSKVAESALQIPYAEILFFAIFALLTGLCIGYLIKKKRVI